MKCITCRKTGKGSKSVTLYHKIYHLDLDGIWTLCGRYHDSNDKISSSPPEGTQLCKVCNTALPNHVLKNI